MTDPPTCCQGMLVTLWVFLNLATQWKRLLQERLPPPTVNACAKGDVALKSSLHHKMNGSEEKLSNDFQQVFCFTEPTERSAIDQAGHSSSVL